MRDGAPRIHEEKENNVRPHHRRRARRRGRGLQGLGPGDRGHLRERAPVALGHRDHRQRRRLLGQRQVHGLHEHPDAVHGPYAHRLRPGRAGGRRAGHPDGGGRRLRRQVLRRQQRGGERDPGPQGAAPGEDHQHPGRGVPGRQPAPGQHEGVGADGLQERRPDPRQAHAHHRRQRRLQRQGAGHHRGGGAAARHLLQVLRRPLRGLSGLHQQDPHRRLPRLRQPVGGVLGGADDGHRRGRAEHGPVRDGAPQRRRTGLRLPPRQPRHKLRAHAVHRPHRADDRLEGEAGQPQAQPRAGHGLHRARERQAPLRRPTTAAPPPSR